MSSASGTVASRVKRVRIGFRRRHPIANYLVGRVLAGVATLFVVSILIFVSTNVLPGSVAYTVLGRDATPAAVHVLEARLDLNRPLVVRYFSWLGGMVHGDLGQSGVAVGEERPNASIASSIRTPLRNSLILAAITVVLLVPLTLLLGGLAGVYAGRTLDHAISAPSLVVSGLPEFVTATALIVIFFTWLGALPPVSLVNPGQSPLSTPDIFILPVLTLLAVAVGSGIRQVRAGFIEVMYQDYFQVAELNGLRGRLLLYRYGLRNALAPAVQSIAQNIQYLVGGIIIVESVFSYPGIGTYLVQAVIAHDVTEVQAAAVILAAVYIAINIVADLVVVLLVPKLRTGIA
jgi:peptide/nickel transport system permease protein